MTESELAVSYIERYPHYRLIPRRMRRGLVCDYVWKRECGLSHSEAKKYALSGISPVVLFILGIVIQLLIEALRKWWEARQKG